MELSLAPYPVITAETPFANAVEFLNSKRLIIVSNRCIKREEGKSVAVTLGDLKNDNIETCVDTSWHEAINMAVRKLIHRRG